MNPTAESPFSVNWRMTDKNGIDCQLTIRATGAEEGLEVEALDILDQRSKVVASMLEDGWTVSAGFGGGRGGTTTTTDPSAPKCGCGVQRVRKSGQGKKGPWAGWMCANRKCDPQWIE